MSLWIKRDSQLHRNQKTYRLAELLAQGSASLFEGRDEIAWRAIAAELLQVFWGHAVEHFPDGDVTDASAAALRDALHPFLTDTAWARGDVRELLLRSGHLDRTPEGRIVIHDWLEWSGSDALRLANDRKRKRLARADASKKKDGRKSRTRPAESDGRGAPKTALEEKRGEEIRQDKGQQQLPAAAPDVSAKYPLTYATRCCIAVNQELERLLAGAYRTLVATVEAPIAEAWEAAGIPIGLAEQVCRDRTAGFRSTPLNRQPNTLRYFDAAVREAAAKREASDAPRPLKDFEAMEQLAEAERLRELKAAP